jgi:hypothetical protein
MDILERIRRISYEEAANNRNISELRLNSQDYEELIDELSTQNNDPRPKPPIKPSLDAWLNNSEPSYDYENVWYRENVEAWNLRNAFGYQEFLIYTIAGTVRIRKKYGQGPIDIIRAP